MGLQIRRGLQADLQAGNLLIGEPAFCTDTKVFMIGDGGEGVIIPSDLTVSEFLAALADLPDLLQDCEDATIAAENIVGIINAELEQYIQETPSENLINEDSCVPYPTKETTDSISQFMPLTEGEYYCLTQGTSAMRTYLYLYLYDAGENLIGSVHNGESDALWTGTGKTVNFTNPTELRAGYGFQCPEGAAFARLRWTHSRNNRTISAFADGGNGTVIVTATNHALLLVAGTAEIVITNSTDYDGTYTATYINANSFSIQATFTQTRTGKAARYNFLASAPMLNVSPDDATYTFSRWVTGVPEMILNPDLIAGYRAADLAEVKANLINRVGLRVYVSPTGSDSNDGLTPETPYLTFKKAADQNPSEVYAFRGVYQHTTSASFEGLNSLKILPYDNDDEYAHENPDRQMITIDNGVDLDSLTLVDGLYEQVFASNTFLNHVFVAQDQLPGTEGAYNANCWQHSDTEGDNKALKPVLSKVLCLTEAGTFFYDGTKIYINPYETAYTGFSVPNTTVRLEFIDIRDLTIIDVEAKHQHYSNFILQNIGNINMQNCAGKYACVNDAFDIDNVNGRFERCYATRSGNDGFNIHTYGDTTFLNCRSTYNYDDGMSHHDGCTGTVIGGEYSYNGKGGVVPAYGAEVNIYDTFCAGNEDFGIGYLTTTNGHASMSGRCANCLMVNNINHGLRVDALAAVIAYGNVYSGNGAATGGLGSLTSY